MTISSTLRLAGACLVIAAGTLGSVHAQTYPVKPIRAVMPYSAGSGPDALLRAMGEKMARDLGQPLVVDNKPGGNGWIGVGEAKRAAPDGYTILMCDANIMTLHQSLFKQVPFDAKKDFDAIAPLYSTSNFVVVNINSPWNKLSDLIAAARAKEGEVTYASWGIGSPGHIGAEMVQAGSGTKMRHIPYKDIPSVYVAVGSGEVQWALGSPGSTAAMLQAKKIKILAYTGPQRLAGFPDVPTVAEEGGGLSKFELTTWAALYMPHGAPKAAIDRVTASVVKALNEPEIKERLAASGFTPWFATPAEFARAADADRAKYAEIVRRVGITVE
jgi:tripartite-type tricarboxylate transporter receptor subunit TctC